MSNALTFNIFVEKAILDQHMKDYRYCPYSDDIKKLILSTYVVPEFDEGLDREIQKIILSYEIKTHELAAQVAREQLKSID